jgi:hypothetical protein
VPDARRRAVEGLPWSPQAHWERPRVRVRCRFQHGSDGDNLARTGPRLHGAKTSRGQDFQATQAGLSPPRNRAGACLSSAQGPIPFLIVALWVYFSGAAMVSEENAYVGSTNVAVAPQVSGKISEIDVSQNESVKAATRLFQCYRASACGFGRGNLTLLDHAGPGR